MEDFKHFFEGTGVALVTPFLEDLSVDYTSLSKLVNCVIEGGVDYLVALGTTAETPTLSEDEKKQILKHIIDTAEGRVKVICGVGGNNTGEIIHQLHKWDFSGVSGILSVAPYYNRPTQEGMYRHFKAIAENTGLPIILYNVPARTGSNINAETVVRLAADFKNIIAVKEASGILPQMMEIINNAPEGFTTLSGDDLLIVPQMAIGARGVISVAANCFTHEFTTMVHAGLEGRFLQSRESHYMLMHGINLLFKEGNPAGVKEALYQQGIIKTPDVRLPLVKASEGLKKEIKDYLHWL